MVKIPLLFLFLVIASPAFAEYRVYQLKITDTQSQQTREVLTTLMPKAYIVYYPIRSTEMVEIKDHWMCFQRSDGFQKPCTRPFASLEQSPKTGLPSNDQGNVPNN